MKAKILIIIFISLINPCYSQDTKIFPSIEVVSPTPRFLEFVNSFIIDKEDTSECSKYYWYLYERENKEIILTKSPLSSILSYNVLNKDIKGMVLIIGKVKIFMNIKSESIFNKQIYNSGLFVDFSYFDINTADVVFHDCRAYKVGESALNFLKTKE